ncbi:ubiquitin carboxyl-terminal hydrolase of the cysteine proteinase fold [Cryptosporidium ryanae]|uniref:ubiquitin carboxyl-terminal hydrolase of the cysteine proteinase fold n=1 Tax=Cryptosporidium ryanae TaxID=515981 RepID=UPI00351A9AFC|nr:ubiquitin carboxyl-terminal hydrolase of the cysteine proteinase fold [Cryptosporidium ryanae]
MSLEGTGVDVSYMNKSSETLQLSNRVVKYVPDGYLTQMPDCEINTNLNPLGGTEKREEARKERLENNAPLGKPEYYYFPPELIFGVKESLRFTQNEVEKFGNVGRGLSNPGWNTCYLNSILQALTYAPYLSSDCLRRNHQSICKHKSDGLVCLMCMFEDHVNRVFGNTDDSYSSFSLKNEQKDKEIVPQFVKCAQRLIWKKFRIGIMQDAQEFLRFFLEALHKACLPKNLQDDRFFRKLNPITASTTYIGQLFCGFFRSKIVCSSCGYISNTYDPFMDVPLDIMGVSTLENALKLFTKTEYLRGENRYMCPNCKVKSDASKQLLIEKLPPLLTIQLKRFSFFGFGSKKPTKPINFSETIDMKPFMASKHSDFSCIDSNEQDCDELSLKYKLWAVVCHAGNTLSCGHYYTYAKSIDNKWYCLNDEQVSPTTLDNVLSQNNKAYLLFYYKTNIFINYQDKHNNPESNSNNHYLAPEISFINFKEKIENGCGYSSKGSNSHSFKKEKSEDLSDFLDKLELYKKQKSKFNETRLLNSETTKNNETDSFLNMEDGIKLVLTPDLSYSSSSSISTAPTSTSSIDSLLATSKKDKERDSKFISSKSQNLGNKSPRLRLRNKRMLSKLKTLLFGDWSIISKTRRNFQSIICFKKFISLLFHGKQVGQSVLSKYPILDNSDNGSSILHDKTNCIDLTSLQKNVVERWDDLELTLNDESMIGDAQRSLLPKTNIRSDYDKEYDKGKVKKPLRQALKQAVNPTSKSFKTDVANRELFDLVQKNKRRNNSGPLRNINKKKLVKAKE